MATTQKTASPKKKSEGFQGVRNAFIIILVTSDKDKYVDNVTALIRALGYPKP